MSLWKDIIVSVIIMMVLDLLWIFLIMSKFYQNLILKIQNSPLEIDFVAAGLCYLCLEFGLIYFVIYKIEKFDILKILSLSVPFGLVTYGTYDFTSASVLKNFGLLAAFIDVIWGITLMSLTALSTIFVRRYFDCENNNSEENDDRIK